eukprot:11158508-Lingulodinium_polyedra.AAC.1
MVAIRSCCRSRGPTATVKPSPLNRVMSKRNSHLLQVSIKFEQMCCLPERLSHAAAKSAIKSALR